jgi:hypothetical protein
MIPEDDGTTVGSQELRPYSILLIACALAAGKLGALFVSRAVHEVFGAKDAASSGAAVGLVFGGSES